MARYDLRLSDEEFLRETPYSISLLMERDKAKDFKMYHGFAKVVAVLANSSNDFKKNPRGYSEIDFIPEHLVPVHLRRKKFNQLTPMEQRKILAEVFNHSLDKDGKIIPKKGVKRGATKVAK